MEHSVKKRRKIKRNLCSDPDFVVQYDNQTKLVRAAHDVLADVNNQIAEVIAVAQQQDVNDYQIAAAFKEIDRLRDKKKYLENFINFC